MSRKSIGIVLLVIGVLILLVSALADVVGLGADPQVFGYRQIAGVAAGAAIGVIGGVLYWRAGGQR